MEKKKLYDSFFSAMNYPVDLAIDSVEGTDRKIVRACIKKNSAPISGIYFLRRMKKIIRGFFKL